jgi:hypothetical protein
MGCAACSGTHGARRLARGIGMQPLGKGKAVRRGLSGVIGGAPLGMTPIGAGTPDEEVYLAPGMPSGVSASELKALPVPLQMLVMEAWFRANFHPAPYQPSGDSTDPVLELAGEFGRAAQGQAIETLGRALLVETRIWVTETGLDRIAAAERLGIVIGSADPRVSRRDTAEATILARLDGVEKALAKLQPPRGGIGHNNPPDGLLTREEHAEASAAVADLREDASAGRPDPSRAQRAMQALGKVAAALGHRIWNRVAEMTIDEAIKMTVVAVGLGGLVPGALDTWQQLNALIAAVGRWISLLGS